MTSIDVRISAVRMETWRQTGAAVVEVMVPETWEGCRRDVGPGCDRPDAADGDHLLLAQERSGFVINAEARARNIPYAPTGLASPLHTQALTAYFAQRGDVPA